MSQELIGGIPRSDLEFVVRMANESDWTLGHCLYEILADEEKTFASSFIFARNNVSAYWFLFDNLNREDAQLLWVWRYNWLRFGANRIVA
jgi:hypothetical protein